MVAVAGSGHRSWVLVRDRRRAVTVQREGAGRLVGPISRRLATKVIHAQSREPERRRLRYASAATDAGDKWRPALSSVEILGVTVMTPGSEVSPWHGGRVGACH